MVLYKIDTMYFELEKEHLKKHNVIKVQKSDGNIILDKEEYKSMYENLEMGKVIGKTQALLFGPYGYRDDYKIIPCQEINLKRDKVFEIKEFYLEDEDKMVDMVMFEIGGLTYYINVHE